MLELQGKYNTAKVFTNNIEEEAISQIIELCNQEAFKDSKIRIMPDVHAGVGCTVGTTMTIKNRIIPNLVGVDIGCGMLCIELKEKEIDLAKLDEIINNYIPSGFNIREKQHHFTKYLNLEELKCKNFVSLERAYLSLGTLGGGNHFIEINKNNNGNLYLVIHSGSRHLGLEVAKYYQGEAYKQTNKSSKDDEIALIERLKKEGKQQSIEKEINKLRFTKRTNIPKDLTYAEGELFQQYIHDMKIIQKYAEFNRHAMASDIFRYMNLNMEYNFTTIHNYIDTENMILRKGAISAKQNERVIIPINMKDGSIIAIGKGNSDWNYSAPHGAGRLMSRTKAKENLNMDDFKQQMDGIYSTSISEQTLDEAPMAYKPIYEILENIKDTIDVIDIVKPIYNFKAGGR